jgi:hypothetical protein
MWQPFPGGKRVKVVSKRAANGKTNRLGQSSEWMYAALIPHLCETFVMLRRTALFFLCSLTSAAIACAQAEKSSIPEPEAKVEKVPENADPDRFARAPVVLRVKLAKSLGGETGVAWYQMKVVATLKNTVRQKFGPTQDVFTAGRIGPGIPRDPGPPAEECTIYIEPIVQRVGAADVTHWRLLDGNSTSGVSHVAK